MAKPKEILEIEKILGIELVTRLYDNDGKGVYRVDDNSNLVELHLQNLNIIDISFLSKYQNLHTLLLSNNNIVDISPLSKLKNLVFLNLSPEISSMCR